MILLNIKSRRSDRARGRNRERESAWKQPAAQVETGARDQQQQQQQLQQPEREVQQKQQQQQQSYDSIQGSSDIVFKTETLDGVTFLSLPVAVPKDQMAA